MNRAETSPRWNRFRSIGIRHYGGIQHGARIKASLYCGKKIMHLLPSGSKVKQMVRRFRK